MQDENEAALVVRTEVQLDKGIDRSASEATGNAPRDIVNLVPETAGRLVTRGGLVQHSLAPAVTLAADPITGQLLPVTKTSVPMDLFAMVHPGERLLAVQAMSNDSGNTLVVMTVRAESVTSALSLVQEPTRLYMVLLSPGGTVIDTSVVEYNRPFASVTIAVHPQDRQRWLVAAEDSSDGSIAMWFVHLAGVTLIVAGGSNVVTGKSQAWARNGFVLVAAITDVVLYYYNTAGLLRAKVVSPTATVGSEMFIISDPPVGYHEMGWYQDDTHVYILSAGQGGQRVRVVKIPLATPLSSVADTEVLLESTPYDRRFAAMVGDIPGTTISLIVERPSPHQGVTVCQLLVSDLTVVSQSTHVNGNLAIADAGGYRVVPHPTIPGSTTIEGLIGLTSFEAAETEYRSHVLCTVTRKGITPAGIVAHADAGVYTSENRVHAQARFWQQQGALPRWDVASQLLPVPVIVRTTSDDAIAINYDLEQPDRWTRSVRLVRILPPTAATVRPSTVTLGPNVYVGGTLPRAYDGNAFNPAGFLMPPHTALAEGGGGTLGGPHGSSPVTTGTGTFPYQVRQQFIDSRGTIWESPVAPVGQESTGLATPTDRVSVTVWRDTLFEERRIYDVARFTTELFRTADSLENGATSLQEIYTVGHGGNDGPLNWADGVSPAEAQTGEILPDPLNGRIQAGPLPSLRALIVHRSRLFGLDMWDRELVRFTTEYVAPYAPLWADELSFRVANGAGQLTALASLTDKVVVFQADRVSIVTGEGPDGNGQGLFSTAEKVLDGIGCDGQPKVAECPQGVMFVHRTGIYMLGTDLSLNPIGQRLQYRNEDLGITGLRYLPSIGQVWAFASGTTYIYDLITGKWSRLVTALGTLIDAVSVGSVTYCMTASAIYRYDLTVHEDGISGFDAWIDTPWVKAERGKEMRVRKVLTAGQADDSTVLTVTTKTRQWRNTVATETTGTSVFMLPAGEFRAVIPARTRRCSEVSFRVHVAQDIVTDPLDAAPAIRLDSITVEASVLPGTGKVPRASRPGTVS